MDVCPKYKSFYANLYKNHLVEKKLSAQIVVLRYIQYIVSGSKAIFLIVKINIRVMTTVLHFVSALK